MIKQLLAPVFLCSVVHVAAQEQLDAPGFESWTNAGSATQEPAEWSSLKTSDGGFFLNSVVPQLCWRSTDARSGTYSVELRTVSSAVGPANGLLTNGRVHAELDVSNSYMFTDQDEEQWRTSLISRPDSVVGWFKATPAAGDRANVGVLLHVDNGRLPAFGTEANYVAGASWKAPFGPVGEWTRFSAPFQYLDDRTPDWILLILTSGDSAGSVVGSRVWFDDLALIYNVHSLPSAPEVTLVPGVGAPINIAYSTGGAPTAPILFRAELSDAQGSFANPLVIGTLVSNSAEGQIACALPSDLVPGNGYRVRVSTPSPFYAPVPSPLSLVAATAVDEATGPTVVVTRSQEQLVVDMRSVGQGAAQLDILDLTGRAVHRQTLVPGALNTIDANELPNVLLLRVTHEHGGIWVRRMIW
jgi:hypothetical protein